MHLVETLKLIWSVPSGLEPSTLMRQWILSSMPIGQNRLKTRLLLTRIPMTSSSESSKLRTWPQVLQQQPCNAFGCGGCLLVFEPWPRGQAIFSLLFFTGGPPPARRERLLGRRVRRLAGNLQKRTMRFPARTGHTLSRFFFLVAGPKPGLNF